MNGLALKPWLKALSPGFCQQWWRKIETSPLAYRLARGAFWSLAGAAISRGLMLLSSVWVARMLGNVSYGEMGIIQSTVGMFGTFAGFGMGMTSTKFVAEFRAKDPARAGRVIALSSLTAWISGSLMALLLLGSAGWLAHHTLAAPRLTPLLQFSSLLLLLSTVNGAQNGALSGFEAFKQIAHINLWSGIATLPLMVTAVFLWGLPGAIVGLTASQAVNSALTYLALRRQAALARVPLGYASCVRECSVLWKFSVPALLCGAMVGPVSWLCNTLLINRPNGYSQMGLFSAANQWLGALMFLPGILGQAALPVLSDRLGQNDRTGAARILGFYLRLNLIVAAPLVVLGSLASPYIMAAYGRSFAGGWPTLIVVLVTAGLLASQYTIGQVLIASGKLWLGFFMNLGWATAYLGFAALLVSHGALGLSTARLLAYVLHTIWTLGFAVVVIRKTGERREPSL